MKPLYLNIEADTPAVSLDVDKNIFSINGKSLPENAALFYKPIYDWFVEFTQNHPSKIVSFDVDLEYLNSSSIKLLFLILSKINEHYINQGEGSETNIIWRFNTNDDLTKHKGEEFQALLDVPVLLKAKN
ncbi:MAG: DUF1987 domain-containing protein [Putridiphycobacter sp.]